MAHTTDVAPIVPAVDLGTNGHLPFLVQDTEAAREHPEHLLTPAETTPVLDYGLGAWLTAPVETELRDIDDNGSRADVEQNPLLAAQIMVSDYRPQAYGRHTEIWLHYGRSTGSMTPAKAREVLEALRGFLPRLEAVVALAEETSAGDFEGDPEIARLDREAEERRITVRDTARLKASAEGLR
ncbi:hypothetical protein [Streptomyces sp. NPDC006333]|uniref:hypothetical protein n=1 Tax=Streptomyces sp. NPDC006333 TaxID=3156753 RepID=UPI0033A82C96